GPCGLHEDRGMDEVVRAAVVLDEGRAHPAWRHAVDEAGADEAAGGHADVALELREVDPRQRFLERAQRADLVDSAERASAGEREADAAAACATSRLCSNHGYFRIRWTRPAAPTAALAPFSCRPSKDKGAGNGCWRPFRMDGVLPRPRSCASRR